MLYEIDGKPAFRIDLYDHTVANKWKNLIESIYVGDGEDIDHIRSFFNLRTRDEIKKTLLDAVAHINSFLRREFIKIPKKINWEDQDLYNTLHISFEKLSGEFDNPTKLMKIAPMHIQESIRDLNFCVHALEHNSNKNTSEHLTIQWTKKRETMPRVKLIDKEYDLIQFYAKKNEVYLGYNELGKSYYDLWKDNLPLDYEATKNNHYIGADIRIELTDRENIFDKGFLNWCGYNNIDPKDKKNGIGLLPIGKVEILDLEHLTKDSKANIIMERNQKL
jgi:5'-3' exonuclease